MYPPIRLSINRTANPCVLFSFDCSSPWLSEILSDQMSDHCNETVVLCYCKLTCQRPFLSQGCKRQVYVFYSSPRVMVTSLCEQSIFVKTKLSITCKCVNSLDLS